MFLIIGRHMFSLLKLVNEKISSMYDKLALFDHMDKFPPHDFVFLNPTPNGDLLDL